MKRVLVLISEPPGRTSANLFDELVRAISPHCDVRVIQVQAEWQSRIRRGLALIMTNIRAMWAVFWAQTIMLHVFAAGRAPTIVLARLLRRKVVIFQWDVYPMTLAGMSVEISQSRRIANVVEHWLLKHASVLIIPSEDFRPFVESKKVGGVIPLWPQQSLLSLEHIALATEGGPVRIGFAGRIDETRGIEACLQVLERAAVQPVEVHLYSGWPMPGMRDIDLKNVQVVHHGQLDRMALQADLRRMHFGLISLSPMLDQPGYPSKTFDYLAAGLPVLYFGRALPAFTAPLTEAGLGLIISDEEPINLGHAYTALSADFDAKRDAYLARCTLRWSALAEIL